MASKSRLLREWSIAVATNEGFELKMAPLVHFEIRALLKYLVASLVEAAKQGLHALCVLVESPNPFKYNRTFLNMVHCLKAARVVLLTSWKQTFSRHLKQNVHNIDRCCWFW